MWSLFVCLAETKSVLLEENGLLLLPAAAPLRMIDCYLQRWQSEWLEETDRQQQEEQIEGEMLS